MRNKKQRSKNKDKDKDKALPYKQCLNCGTELNGMFCHKCGQQALDKTPTVKEFIVEYMNHAFIWDGFCA